MNADQQQHPRETHATPANRGTVVMMPRRRPQAASPDRPSSPPGHDQPEPTEEPGYGHGV